VLAEHGAPEPGVEGTGERTVLALDQPARTALPARAREHGVVEAALSFVQLLGAQSDEPRLRGAHW
jgi:hypothetical protein